jgi:hypothetical protein
METSNTSFVGVRNLSYTNAGPINPWLLSNTWLVSNTWHTQTSEIGTGLLNISLLKPKHKVQEILKTYYVFNNG